MGFNFRTKGGRVYRSWKKWAEGDVLIAKFIESYEDQFGNECYEVEVIESDFSEEADNLDVGKIFGVNSCGSLKHKMQEVLPGTILRIEYAGTGKVEKGPMAGKDFHNVTLGVDDTGVNSGVVANAVAAQSKLDAEPTEEGDDEYDL